MKRYLQSNDPLFDPVTLGYVLHRGAIRDRNKRLCWQGIKSLVLKFALTRVISFDQFETEWSKPLVKSSQSK